MKLSRRKLAIGASPVIIGIMLGILIINLLPRTSHNTSGTGAAKLEAVKKIFAIGERPSLRLTLPHKPKLANLGVATAEAAEVQTAVKYDGKPVDVPVQVLPGKGSDYTLTLAPTRGIKPGLYAVTATWGPGPGESATQTFAWGVLAINTTQPSYLPGQTVHIQMGVLSSAGHTLCDAPLSLKVYDPAGQELDVAIHKSAVCSGDSFVEVPDYTAEYVPQKAGHYQMKMQLANTEYKMEDGFEVVDALQFEIVRSAPTRLYPPAQYSASITVKSAQDFSGTIREKLPEGFQVTGAGQGGVVPAGEANIEWAAKLKAGTPSTFTYTFKSPPQSPAFYRVQPLEFIAGDKAVYTEPRSWQMAGDAAIAFVKQTVASATTTGSAMTVTATSTAGNMLVVAAGLGSNTVSVTSITDTAGNTWQLAAAATGGSGTRSEIWYALNAAAVTSVTVNVQSDLNLLVNLSEYSGAGLLGAVEVASGQGNTASTSASTPTVVTAQTGDLLIGEVSWTLAGSSTAPGGSYTNLTNPTPVGNKQISPVYQVAASAGSYTATWGLPGSIISSTIMVAFTEPCKNISFQMLRGGKTICTGVKGGYFWAQ